MRDQYLDYTILPNHFVRSYRLTKRKKNMKLPEHLIRKQCLEKLTLTRTYIMRKQKGEIWIKPLNGFE